MLRSPNHSLSSRRLPVILRFLLSIPIILIIIIIIFRKLLICFFKRFFVFSTFSHSLYSSIHLVRLFLKPPMCGLYAKSVRSLRNRKRRAPAVGRYYLFLSFQSPFVLYSFLFVPEFCLYTSKIAFTKFRSVFVSTHNLDLILIYNVFFCVYI